MKIGLPVFWQGCREIILQENPQEMGALYYTLANVTNLHLIISSPVHLYNAS
jgi:hypothetical protein